MFKKNIEKVQEFLGLKDTVFTTKNIARISLLVALAMILKSYGSIETGIYRLTFYDIPLIILGILYGPLVAIMGGLATDFAYVMSRGWIYGINIFTISTLMWALIPALLLFKRRYTVMKLSLTIIITSLIVFLLNTKGLVGFYGQTQLIFLEGFVPGPLFPRVITAFVKVPIQAFLIHNLLTRLASAYEDVELLT